MPRRKRKLTSEINVVPYIDVMLVLLIVFMVTTPLFSQGYQVQLPAVSAKPIKINEKEQLVISVTANKKYYYTVGGSNKEASLTDIKNYLSGLVKQRKDLEIFIKGDRNVAYGGIMEVMEAIGQTGIENVGLVTQPQEK